MTVLRKANSHSVAICWLIKKKKNVRDPRRKTDSNFGFSQTALCLWGFNKKECYVVYIIELLLHQ